MEIAFCPGASDYRLLYSPSDPLGEVDPDPEQMDWSTNLDGVGSLYGDLEVIGPVQQIATQGETLAKGCPPPPPPPPPPANTLPPAESAVGGDQ
jgi:hypothetical protein